MTNRNTQTPGIEPEGPDDSETDWAVFDALTDEEVRLAAEDDPDCRPLTPEQLARGRRAPNVKVIRERLGLSQAELARKVGVDVETLRKWEQNRAVPNRAYRLHLHSIADSIAFLKPAEIPENVSTVEKNHSSEPQLPDMSRLVGWQQVRLVA